LADFEQERPNFDKIVALFLTPLILGKCPRNIVFATHTDNKFKVLQKGKITGGSNFFPQRPNFSSGLAEKFCKELATLGILMDMEKCRISLF
jgi:hypothetical protein